MFIRTVVLALIASVVAFSIADAKKRHHKGCNTHRCDNRVEKKWSEKHPMKHALASWYGYGGQTACTFWAKYGVAHKTLPCGTKIRMCHAGCITAVVQDRGPFVAGREFDLIPATKNAIGCGDLCNVRYRVLR